MTEKDIAQDLEDLKAERNRLRLERHQLRKTVDALTQEVKDLRKLNSSYVQMLSDKPVKTGSLKETIRQQAQQIEQLEKALQMERLQKKYVKAEPKQKQVSEPIKRGRPALTSGMKAEIRKLHAEGKTVREIKERVNVSLGAISKVLNEQK